MNKYYVATLILVILVDFLILIHTTTTTTEWDYEYDIWPKSNREMPECCEGKEYCFSNENYPIDEVKELLLENNFINLVVDDDDGSSDDNLMYRIGDSSSCGKTDNDLIYYITDELDRVRVVVQMEGKLKQTFTVRTCDTSYEEELELKIGTDSRHKVYCKEQYRDYDFIVLSLYSDHTDKYGIEIITKSLPVCCACRYDITS